MEQDFNTTNWTNPCPKYDCRKDKCVCGLEMVRIPASLGDDSEDSKVAPYNGAYCNSLVIYEANDHVYIYTKEGIPTLIDVDASDISTLEQEVIKAQRDIAEFREDIDRFAYFFDTVAEMKASDQLQAGDYARTLGYRSINDGGTALYKIRSKTNSDVIDEKFILPIIGYINLVAEIVVGDSISPEQIGCVNDGISDDAVFIQDCINYSKSTGVKVTFGHDIYYIKTSINIPGKYSIDFGGSKLKAIASLDEGMINVKMTSNVHNGILCNVALDQNGITNKGLYLYRSYRRTYENIEVSNTPAGGYGIYITAQPGGSGGGNQFNNIKGDGDIKNSTFIYIDTNDNVFNHIDYRAYTIGIETNKFVRLYDVHGYIASRVDPVEDWYTGSTFIKINDGGSIFADDLYPDTHNFCFYNASVIASTIGKIFFTFNQDTPQLGITSVMFKANNDNVSLFYRWKVDEIQLRFSPPVDFELVKLFNNLYSYIEIGNINGGGGITAEIPPLPLIRYSIPAENFTKLGIYGDNAVAIGTSPYAAVSSERYVCHINNWSSRELIDGYYPFKGYDGTNLFDGVAKVENGDIIIMPNASQVAGFQFTISVPTIKATIASP